MKKYSVDCPRFFWFVVLMGLALATGCARQAARSQQTVMVYTAFPGPTPDEWAAAFEKATGIHVEQVKEGTTRIYSRLKAEQGYPRADVWIGGGGMVPFITAADENLLAPYRPRGWESCPVERDHLILRDRQWRWIGATIIGLGFAYNPKVTPESELPKRWEDLADPKWKDQIIMWDPADSGTAMLFLGAALLRSKQATGSEAAGWRYLKAFYHNLKRYANEGPPSLMVSHGDVKIGIHFEHQVLIFLQQSHDPRAIQIAQQNLRWTILPQSPVIVDPIALIRNGPHPENGKKFIDFIMSHQGQAIIHKYFFTMDRSFGPPPYLNYTLNDLLSRAMPIDPDWMGSEFNRIRTRWENQIETSRWIWETDQPAEPPPPSPKPGGGSVGVRRSIKPGGGQK